jgi:glycosyltransferase involved in cell wall biosynthesis
MKFLWLSWKDSGHPLAGGAEAVTDNLLSRLAASGHDVTLLTSHYKGASHTDTKNGYRIVRTGGRVSVYWQAYKYYSAHFQTTHFDHIIEEVNTVPYFSSLYVKQVGDSKTEHSVMFHQLAREIWFYEMMFPLSVIGYCIEPLYLRFLSHIARGSHVVTVSRSTYENLVDHGFNPPRITVISEGVSTDALEVLPEKSLATPILLSLGAMRSMKRTLDVVKAFEFAKKRSPGLKLVLAGDSTSPYGNKVQEYCKKSVFAHDIRILGRVSHEEKIAIMTEAAAIVVTSVREGWGLIVTEANRRGTPAVVYNVEGLRDAVQDGRTGLVSKRNTPESLALSITELFSNGEFYKGLQRNAWKWSKEITFEKQYEDFTVAIGMVERPRHLEAKRMRS